jgi:multidrug resistance efflux pump
MLRRFADKCLQYRLAELEAELASRERTIRIQQAEIESLAAVVARDRERIKAEAASYARQRAESEGINGRTG